MIALATIGLSLLTQFVADLFGIKLPEQEQTKIAYYIGTHCLESAQHFKAFLQLLLMVLVFAPVAEETLFRLPTRLTWKRKAWVWALCAVLISALFSFSHYPDYTVLFKGQGLRLNPPDGAFVALFFFGLAQCWLYLRTRSIWCAMLNHLLFNATNLALMFMFPQLVGA